MLAFLKRRWILISCAVVLLVCSFVDIAMNHTRYDTGKGERANCYGVADGEFFFYRTTYFMRMSEDPPVPANSEESEGFTFAVHKPTFGRAEGTWTPGEYHLEIAGPLWLPLAAILGWIVIRELRFREKRAETTGTLEIEP